MLESSLIKTQFQRASCPKEWTLEFHVLGITLQLYMVCVPASIVCGSP